MDLAARNEARLDPTRSVLLVLSGDGTPVERFHGRVVTPADLGTGRSDLSGTTVYLCGDLAQTTAHAAALERAERGFVIGDRSHGTPAEPAAAWPTIGIGRVPQRIEGVGVLCPQFFDPRIDYAARICTEHALQDLTQSTKPGRAHRTGIYLTPVERVGDDLYFRLLRCSTNLSGPTETFRATDTEIVQALNDEARWLFDDPAELNHVLAQRYHNTPPTDQRKQTKAKIKAHADKTKDMPDNAIMAFCTFYEGLDGLQPLAGDPLDRGHGRASALTTLRFRRKSTDDPAAASAPADVSVTLYPGSVFFMPLSTNRWYTHEIRPSSLDAARLPTRLGYVVRCSSTEAVHREGKTWLRSGTGWTPLEPPTPEGMAELRRLYAEQNRSHRFIDYADRFPFSMNQGDYLAPRD